MISINEELLEGLGASSLPSWEKNLLLKHIYETLEQRVGANLADRMSNDQLDEFETLFEAKDEKGVFAWMESNFPDYKEIVQSEFDALVEELTEAVPQILAYSRRDSGPTPPLSRTKSRRSTASDATLRVAASHGEGRRIRG